MRVAARRFGSPLRRGFWWAAAAALAYGVTTPLIAVAARGVGPWSIAAWLYAGAAAFALLALHDSAPLIRGMRMQPLRLTCVAFVGGMAAPGAFAAGLAAAGPLTASLALNMEAPFSAVIAVAFFREHLGRRALGALAAIVAGTTALAFVGGSATIAGWPSIAGAALVVAAAALWAIDNALSAGLAGLDPRATVVWKGALGAALGFATAASRGEARPSAAAIAALLAIGAGGYGASLVCYLIAQRRFGVARTASVFAAAPFVGATGSLLLGRLPGPLGAAAVAAIAAGVWLHVTERHDHEHRHEAGEHDHVHRHDDGHHDHPHAEAVAGEHRHVHVHAALVHAHEHAPDHDHRHPHDDRARDSAAQT